MTVAAPLVRPMRRVAFAVLAILFFFYGSFWHRSGEDNISPWRMVLRDTNLLRKHNDLTFHLAYVYPPGDGWSLSLSRAQADYVRLVTEMQHCVTEFLITIDHRNKSAADSLTDGTSSDMIDFSTQLMQMAQNMASASSMFCTASDARPQTRLIFLNRTVQDLVIRAAFGVERADVPDLNAMWKNALMYLAIPLHSRTQFTLHLDSDFSLVMHPDTKSAPWLQIALQAFSDYSSILAMDFVGCLHTATGKVGGSGPDNSGFRSMGRVAPLHCPRSCNAKLLSDTVANWWSTQAFIVSNENFLGMYPLPFSIHWFQIEKMLTFGAELVIWNNQKVPAQIAWLSPQDWHVCKAPSQPNWNASSVSWSSPPEWASNYTGKSSILVWLTRHVARYFHRWAIGLSVMLNCVDKVP
eukprot:TRINITY_DN19223_c0_g1_i1.p1 TRINITY_DN19223_c0_g1~~TRINITY_DN19223_c0_g1_i1.p1  ORF type:complete len:428 (-),score=44.14 TRINITY_DN19223_c0_g1_i1:371-1600(-)